MAPAARPTRTSTIGYGLRSHSPPRTKAAAPSSTRRRNSRSPTARRVYDRPVPGSLDPPLHPEDHVRGSADAPYELVMYGDFECPYCAAAQSILARVFDRLGDELRFAFRHFPIPQVHPHAQHAAEAAEAAAVQGAFWDMHDKLYAARGHLTDRDLVAHAAGLGLDGDRLGVELASGAHAARVAADHEAGRRSGVQGTPGFFVNGRLYTETYDAGSLVAALTSTAA